MLDQRSITANGKMLSNELQVLLACAQHAFSGNPLNLNSILFENTNWETLVNAAVFHKLGTILHLGFENLEVNPIPPNLRLILGFKAKKSCDLAEKATQRLISVSQLLTAYGLPYLAYKGPIASKLMYAYSHSRQFTDLDLLIPRNHFEQTRNFLLDNGFSYHDSIEQELQIGERTLIDPSVELSIDLHWTLVPPYMFLKDRFSYNFDNPRIVYINSNPIPTLQPEVMLLDICLQGTKERWGSLCRVVDLAGFLWQQNNFIDWDKVVSVCHDTGYSKILQLGMEITSRFFPLLTEYTLPKHVRPNSPPKALNNIIDQKFTHLIDLETASVNSLSSKYRDTRKQQPSTPTGPANPWVILSSYEPREWYRYIRLLADNPFDKTRFYWHYIKFYAHLIVAPQPHDLEKIKLPRFLNFLHYFIRPLRLTTKYSVRYFRK